MSEMRALLSIVRNDLALWVRRPSQIFVTLAPVLGLALLFLLFSSAVGRQPVALVIMDDGPAARQLVDALEGSDAYILYRETADHARTELAELRVHAIITIPTGFSDRYEAHQADPVSIEINNLNNDMTLDLRRSLPAAITDFYEAQPDSPIDVEVRETDLRTQDIGLLEFMLLPNIVLLVTVSGLVNTGLSTGREFEERTIAELALAPIGRGVIVAGKLLAGWLTTLVLAAVVLVLGAASGFLAPSGWYWLPTVGMVALYALAAAGLGAAIGVALRRIASVSVVSLTLAFYLFFLSGGISVAAFLPEWIQTVAHFIPSYYAVHALDMAVFYGSTDELGRDAAMVAATAVITVLIGARALDRRIES